MSRRPAPAAVTTLVVLLVLLCLGFALGSGGTRAQGSPTAGALEGAFDGTHAADDARSLSPQPE